MLLLMRSIVLTLGMLMLPAPSSSPMRARSRERISSESRIRSAWLKSAR